MRLENTHFNENEIDSAREGGAIAVEEGDLTVVDSTVSGNVTDSDLTDGRGGGIYSESERHADPERSRRLQQHRRWRRRRRRLSARGQADDRRRLVREQPRGRRRRHRHRPRLHGPHRTRPRRRQRSRGNRRRHRLPGRRARPPRLHRLRQLERTNPAATAFRSRGPTTIEYSTLSGNGVAVGGGEAGEASAIGVEGELTLLNSTVAENDGVGIEAISGTTVIRGSTIAANKASEAAAGGISGEGAVSMVSSILALNEGDEGPADCDTTIASGGDNLLQTTAGCDWEAAAGDIFDADPELGALGENGGATKTMGPVSRASAAINNGSEPEPFDQRGSVTAGARGRGQHRHRRLRGAGAGKRRTAVHRPLRRRSGTGRRRNADLLTGDLEHRHGHRRDPGLHLVQRR